MAEYETLAVRSIGAGGDPGRPTLVLLHGFTQTGASWAPVAQALAPRCQVLTPDAPGHGASSHVQADLWATADLLAETLTRAAQRPATWVGYSMGGRMALHVALAHPEAVQRLVLISTTAGIEDEAARRERETSDNALATRLEIEGTEAFLSWWLNRPLFATLAPGSAGLADRLTNTAAGLASSLRTAGVGCQAPLWGRLTELGSRGVPVLLIAGELDAAYCRHAERMASAIGAYTRLCFIEGAGHACHLEQPAEVAAAIDDFLQRSPERA